MPVTRNFASDAPLNRQACDALAAAFDQGWADPKKLSQQSVAANRLKNSAIESIASKLHIHPESIDICGEPDLLPFLAIAGIEVDGRSLFFGATERGKVRAVAGGLGGQVIDVGSDGRYLAPRKISNDATAAISLVNGETGVVQDNQVLIDSFQSLAIDATFSGITTELPQNWKTAFYDARSWQGPAGLGILAIKDHAQYRYPLPHNAPIRVPGSYSLPLLIASSVAIESYDNNAEHLQKLNSHLRSHLSKMEHVQVVGDGVDCDPRVISAIVSDEIPEELLRRLLKSHISIDAGSACSPENLQPSHVLAEMGLPTSGHIRLYLRSEHTIADIDGLIANLRRN